MTARDRLVIALARVLREHFSRDIPRAMRIELADLANEVLVEAEREAQMSTRVEALESWRRTGGDGGVSEGKRSDMVAALRQDIRDGMPVEIVVAYARKHLAALRDLPETTCAEREQAIADTEAFLAEYGACNG